ncbi:RHS repeat-associated core domain protein [Anaerohalosphaera lusitana]|uniref:RHS repeat-associated core domain protein n=1 Tax=Anaerohalosphaera lusitana TaxID=1936003 RepID=A0A1U9NP65_9BACT|nr:RHS repeat-associated core domain-containing protein [Anaerohalosphaera lusitana]AQT69306.1 RHS repeat-associated core domain protein [Anaerohalosphaera lusitana]
MEYTVDSGTESESASCIYGNYVDEALLMADANGDRTHAYIHNNLYSPVAMIDWTDGTIAERCEYSVYGTATVRLPGPDGSYYTADDITQDAPKTANPYLYTGRRLDILEGGSLKLQYSRHRYYDPQTGRFLQKDPLGIAPFGLILGNSFDPVGQYDGGLLAYSYGRLIPTIAVDFLGLKDYAIGNGPRPDINWDDNYEYDASAKPTLKDYLYWFIFRELLKTLEATGFMPDAARAYRHYRGASGDDLHVKYNKAIKEDAKIRRSFESEIAGAQADIERLHDGETKEFWVYSQEERGTGHPETQNWQKALGGHCIWGEGPVKYDSATCEYSFHISIEMEDWYNFNPAQNDIATGLPDEINGRFQRLGWAKAFFSRGKVERTVKWKRGKASTTTEIDGEPRRRSRRRFR